MTGTWIYSFHTFSYFDQTWDAEAELWNNRLRVERILQDTKCYVKGREKNAYLPNGIYQILYVRYSGLQWKNSMYSIKVFPEQIVLEIPVTVPEADQIAAKWKKWLGLPADPVRTRIRLTEEEMNQPTLLPEMEVLPYRDEVYFKAGLYSPEDLPKPVSLKGERMEEKANVIREKIMEIYLELERCSRRNCSRTQIKKNNRLMDRLNDTVRTEIGEDWFLYEAVFLPLLEHETEYIRGRAASHCLYHNIAPERCVPILEEIRDTTDNIMLRVDCGMSVWVYQNPQNTER